MSICRDADGAHWNSSVLTIYAVFASTDTGRTLRSRRPTKLCGDAFHRYFFIFFLLFGYGRDLRVLASIPVIPNYATVPTRQCHPLVPSLMQPSSFRI